MIKCILFDLDGVIADATEWHYQAFNEALTETGFTQISYDEHIKYYNGLPTINKINILRSKGANISIDQEKRIRKLKQEHTVKCIKKHCQPLPEKIELIKKLKNNGYKIGICTNAVRETLNLILEKMELSGFDITLSNQDISNPKPNPEIWKKAMNTIDVAKEDVIIIEDSPKGIKSAYASGANVLEVSECSDVTPKLVFRKIAELSYKDLQIIIPMAGKGSRFARVGYTLPKPIIPILGKTMIKHVIDNLNIKSAKWFFICLEDHIKEYEIEKKLQEYCKNATIIVQKGYKQGAACSTSLAFEKLNKNSPVMVANSDQYIDTNVYDFLAEGACCDGVIMTFNSEHPKWSYAKVGNKGFVTEVKEKAPISNHATSGIYLWNKADDLINGINDMIEAKDMHNNEFYVAPSFNHCIKREKKYKIMEIKRQQMWGLGTPEDLIKFVDHHEL